MGRHPRVDRGQRKAPPGRHRGATRRARAWLRVRRGNPGRRRGRRRTPGRRNEGRRAMTMNFAAIADHYYLMERENAELKASKQRLMTALAGATTTVLQMEAEYDAMKAVEAAARSQVNHYNDVEVEAWPRRVIAIRDALAAIDAIRKGG